MILKKIYEAQANIIVDKNKCNYCGECIEICPTNSISIVNNELKIRMDECLVCYGCILVCPQKALDVKWSYRKIDLTSK